MNPVLLELIGICASIFLVFSLLFKTNTLKGSIMLRSFNLVGCIIFVIYSILLPSISNSILNAICIVIDIYQLIILSGEAKHNKKLINNGKENIKNGN